MKSVWSLALLLALEFFATARYRDAVDGGGRVAAVPPPPVVRTACAPPKDAGDGSIRPKGERVPARPGAASPC